MRWLFLFVLILNLAYVGWQLSAGNQYQPENVAPLKNVEPIVLLSELDREKSALSAGKPESVSEGDQKLNSQAGKVAEAGNEAESGDEASPAPEGAGDNAVATADHQVQAKVPPGTQAPVKSEAKTTAGAGTGPDERCFSLGPFTSIDNLGGLVRDMRGHVVSADFRSEETDRDTLYWVYLKPEKTMAQAKQTASELRAKKVRDFYIIRNGDKKYGISLGRFRNKASAYGLAKNVSKVGFDVLVEPLERKRTTYWLDYELAQGAELPASLFDQYIKDSEKSNITRKSRVCP